MNPDAVYEGVRNERGCAVTCDGISLKRRTELRNHSATGFEWGLNSGGSAQLALALLCDFYRDDAKALEFYDEFKTDIIAPIGASNWVLKSDMLIEWTRRKMKERRGPSSL